MRIAQLHLAAFGAFTGRRLDFDTGVGALHVVCGPNEAGKSTTLRALSGFLFGIPMRSDDDFLHAYDAMRVGATLELADGTRLSAMRRKGVRNTLIGLDPVTGVEQADRVVPEETVRRVLGGLDETLYRQMYALDLNSLEEGSSALLRGEGELGQSLFQAAAGVAELQDLLQRLDEEAEALFSPRAQKPPLNAALRAFAEQRTALRAAGVRPDAWEVVERRLRDADAALAQVRAQVVESRAALAVAQALARNLPLLAEHRARAARLAELDAVPVLAADAAERRIAAQTLARAAGESSESARVRLDAIAAERARLQRSPAILEQGQAIEAAFHRAAHWLDARDRLPQLLAARTAAIGALHACLEAIVPDTGPDRTSNETDVGAAGSACGPGSVPGSGDARGPGSATERAIDSARVRALLPAATLRARIDGLIEERARLGTQAEEARRRADDLDDEIAQARAVLDRQASDVDPALLREALASVEGLGDLERRLERGAAAHALVQAELDRCAIGLAGVAVDALAHLHVPHAALVDEHRAAFEAIVVQARDVERASEALQADLTARRAELRVLQATGEVVRRSDVVDARARRDAGWRDIERAWHAAGSTQRGASAPDPVPTTSPHDFVAAVREADRLADLLHADAQRATLSEELTVRIADMTSALARHESTRASLDAQRTRRLSDWNVAAAPLRAPGVMPEAARVWLDERARLLERADVARREADELDALRVTLAHADAALASALVQAGLAARRPAEPRTAAVARLRVAVDAAVDARARANDAQQRLERHERGAARLRVEHASLAQAQADWSSTWRDAMRSVGLDGQASVHEARARLQEFDRLERTLDAFERVHAEVDEAQRVVETFESGVRGLTEALDPSAAGLDAGALAGRLYEALQAARSAEARHGELQVEQSRLEQALGDARTRQNAAAEVIRALLEASGGDDIDALVQVEAANAERRTLLARMSALEDDLVRLNACAFDTVRAHADGRDPASVSDEIARLELVLPDLERRADEALEAQIAARRAFEAIDGGDAAAGAAQALQQTTARIVEDARRYARARLARVVLGDVIQHFREQNQGPILGRASALFARMTAGAFDGLSAEFNDAGQVIVGVRPGGARVPVSGMSRGTVDQLYLALRLAAISEAVRAREALPLLIDDLLVHFDDTRSAAALQVLAEMARDTQVIFFTHHEHLAALAAQVLPPDRYVLHRLQPAAHPSGAGPT